MAVLKDGNLVGCSEPSGDAVFDRSETGSLGATYAGVGGRVNAERLAKAVELSGRTETIRFLELASFRLCELARAGYFSGEEIKEMYLRILDVASDVERRKTAEAVSGATEKQLELFNDLLIGR